MKAVLLALAALICIAATAAPLSVSGQLVDLEKGYVVFSSGDAFKLAPDVAIVDDATNLPPPYPVEPGLYALASLDPSTATVTSIRLSRTPLPGGTPAASIPHEYVAEVSSPQPNPELEPPRAIYTSKLSADVLVTITVQVPAETPFLDAIYIATDSSDWNAQAIAMQRIDGRHFQISIRLKGGTEFHYLFTRGSWKTVERDRSGLQRTARLLSVPGGDSMLVNATVYRWADIP